MLEEVVLLLVALVLVGAACWGAAAEADCQGDKSRDAARVTQSSIFSVDSADDHTMQLH